MEVNLKRVFLGEIWQNGNFSVKVACNPSIFRQGIFSLRIVDGEVPI